MPFDIYDYRRDIRNVVITPEIRARFMRMKPGQVAGRHSHDLGHEVFLVLDGQAEFEIENERAVLGPGQMCFARADEKHQVRVVGDQPMTMYLSVTPHLEPTHTSWDEAGKKLPPRYGGSTRNERTAGPPPTEPLERVVDRQAEAARVLAEATARAARVHEMAGPTLKRALSDRDRAAAKLAVDMLWSQLYATRKALQALETAWNEVAQRATEGS